MINQTIFPVFDVNKMDPANIILNKEEKTDIVEDCIQKFYATDVTDFVNSLAEGYDLLQLAYAGHSGSNQCNEKFSDFFSDYQLLIKNARLVNQMITAFSIMALQHHQSAFTFHNKNIQKLSLKQLERCWVMAERMSKSSQVFLIQCNEMIDRSSQVLLSVLGNQKMICEQYQIVQERESCLEKKIDSLKQEAVLLNSKIEHLKEKVALYEDQAIELKKGKVEVNANLSKSVCQLENIKKEKSNLEQESVALELTIKTMGKVRTIFENTKVFWECVKTHCDHLSDSEQVKVWVDSPDDFIETVKTSGLSWVALDKVNHMVSSVMANINDNMDQHFSGLSDEKDVAQNQLQLIEKTKSIPEKQSVENEKMPLLQIYEQIVDPFQTILLQIHQLTTCKNDTASSICRRISEEIDQLIINADEIFNMQSPKEESKGELIQFHNVYEQLKRQSNEEIQILNDLREQLSDLRSRLNDLTQESTELSRYIHDSLQRQINEEEQARRNAVIDTYLPIYGMIDGLLNGQPERAISGYSGFKGFISIYNQEEERLQNRKSLKFIQLNQIDLTITQLDSEKKLKVQQESLATEELARLESAITQLRLDIKKGGKQLTELRNKLFSLKSLSKKYESLKIDLEMIEDLLSADIQDHDYLSSFLKNILQLQNDYKSITFR